MEDRVPDKARIHAIIKFNNGRGALLCNHCNTIIAEGFNHEDKRHYCSKCAQFHATLMDSLETWLYNRRPESLF